MLATFQLNNLLRLETGTFKFQSYGGACSATNVFFEKYILILGFLAFLGVNVLRKMLILMLA